MNNPFTADTRPRSASGVRDCTSESRSTTLTLSKAPVRNSIPKESQADVETAPRSQQNSAILNDSAITSGPREFDMETPASAGTSYNEHSLLRE